MSDDGEDPFDWVGATLDGKYQVDSVVGRGGFGVVYRAQHLGFDERVAVKCLRIPRTLDGAARDDFEREFLAEGRLLHQLSRATAGIVQALDVGAAVSPNKTWTPFIVLEWLDGQSLEAHFEERRAARRGPRSLRSAVELLESAARALGVAHEQGIAHRDVKPANLFLCEIGGRTTLKVLDFGIAKVVRESASISKAFEETGASLQAFTARYGAPEQFSRRYGATGPWTDVFALALVLVEAVVGENALSGADTAQLFIASADSKHRPTLRAFGADAGDAVEAVLLRALAVDPKQRYDNAGAFWDALHAALPVADRVPTLINAEGFLPVEGVGDNVVTGRAAAELLPTNAALASAASFSPNSSAGSATELTAAASPFSAPEVPARAAPSRARRRLLLGAVAITATAVLGVWLAREPTFTAQQVTAEQPSALASSARPRSATDVEPGAGISPTAPSPAVAAPSTASSSAPSFPGLPVRDVAAGLVPASNAWLDKFSVLQREGDAGLEFGQAFARCTDAGKTLCTEAEWQRACAAYPEVGAAPSWTESIEEGRMVVRGGDSCEQRKLSLETEREAPRVGLCCDRAVATSSTSLQKAFLATTAGIVLKLERALNQRDIDGFLELSEEQVVLNDHARDKPALKALLRQSFAAARDLVLVNDRCDVSVSAKKVIVKRSHRARKTSYETLGWTAVCEQTRHRDGKAVSGRSRYEFSPSSKLRAVTDSEARAAVE